MTYARGECRVCDRDSALNSDELVTPHGPRNSRCEGSGRPPKGEPPCANCGRMAGSVHYPPDLFTRPVAVWAKEAHAATWACFDPAHQAEAAAWVESKTGHKGVFTPFAELRPAPAGEAVDA